jgi:hypothetical protein
VLGPMVDILVEELPAFDFVKEEVDEAIDLYSVSLQEQFTEEKVNLLVDKLELHGAACIFYGDKMIRHHGLLCLSIAVKLGETESGFFPKKDLALT